MNQTLTLRDIVNQGPAVYVDPHTRGVINYDGYWFRYWTRLDVDKYEFKAEVARLRFGVEGHQPSRLTQAAANWMINLRRTGTT